MNHVIAVTALIAVLIMFGAILVVVGRIYLKVTGSSRSASPDSQIASYFRFVQVKNE